MSCPSLKKSRSAWATRPRADGPTRCPTISGIAINTLAPGLALFLSRMIFDGATQTPSIALEDKMPRLFDGMIKNQALKNIFSQYANVYIALIFVVLVYVFLYKTKWGLRLIAVGEHPVAAESLDISVVAIRYAAVMFSGFMAGLGGASMSLAVVSVFSPTLIAGQGYIALVCVICICFSCNALCRQIFNTYA